MKLKWSILALAAALSFSGCIIDIDDDDGFPGCTEGDGSFITEEFGLPAFEGVSLRNTVDVFITQGPNQEVVVEGFENIIDRLELDVDDGILEIDFRGCVRDIGDMKIFITMPTIVALEITGTGDIRGENLFVVNDIELDVTGTGDMDLALEADDIDARITGTGDIRLEGVADELRATITGTGDLEAFQLETRFADITVTGTGDAEVFVTEQLLGRITGTGNIRYIGFPDVIDVEDTGPGDLIDEN